MTTVYTETEMTSILRRRPTGNSSASRPIQREFGDQPTKQQDIPSIIFRYNQHMGAVDEADQLRASEGLDDRQRNGPWKALAWKFLLETCLVNSYLLQARGQPRWSPYTDQHQWRQRLVNDIVRTFSQQGLSRQRLRTGDEFTLITEHTRVNKGSCGPCLACKGLRVGQPRRRQKPLQDRDPNSLTKVPQTRSRCATCNVSLCNSKRCWYFWHQPLA